MYHRPRIIPCILLDHGNMVKTVRFSNPRYIGDPVNAVRIFNNKGVDELCIFDICASQEQRGPDMELLQDIASEAFMPLGYGGGITSINQVRQIFSIGYEKVIINTALVHNPIFIQEASAFAGSQSVVASIDVKEDMLGRKLCWVRDGSDKTKYSPVELAKEAERLGAGEILLNSISRDGTMKGYDIELIKSVACAVSIPVIGCGGAGNLNDILQVLTEGGAHAAAGGSMFVYYGIHNAVLITVPSEAEMIDKGIFTEEA